MIASKSYIRQHVRVWQRSVQASDLQRFAAHVPQASSCTQPAGTHALPCTVVSDLRHNCTHVQMLAYWVLYKFDLFHYKSGAMVATRDDHEFEGKPGPELAAGRLESKALESALKSTSTQATRLSKQARRQSFIATALPFLSETCTPLG